MSKLTNDGITRSMLYSCTQMATVGVKGLSLSESVWKNCASIFGAARKWYIRAPADDEDGDVLVCGPSELHLSVHGQPTTARRVRNQSMTTFDVNHQASKPRILAGA